MSKLYYFFVQKATLFHAEVWIIDKGKEDIQQHQHSQQNTYAKQEPERDFSGNLFPFWCDEILAGASDQSQEHGIRKKRRQQRWTKVLRNFVQVCVPDHLDCKI